MTPARPVNGRALIRHSRRQFAKRSPSQGAWAALAAPPVLLGHPCAAPEKMHKLVLFAPANNHTGAGTAPAPHGSSGPDVEQSARQPKAAYVGWRAIGRQCGQISVQLDCGTSASGTRTCHFYTASRRREYHFETVRREPDARDRNRVPRSCASDPLGGGWTVGITR